MFLANIFFCHTKEQHLCCHHIPKPICKREELGMCLCSQLHLLFTSSVSPSIFYNRAARRKRNKERQTDRERQTYRECGLGINCQGQRRSTSVFTISFLYHLLSFSPLFCLSAPESTLAPESNNNCLYFKGFKHCFQKLRCSLKRSISTSEDQHCHLLQ